MERKLAAIFSADVKGCSRLMGDDETATIRALTTYREVLATFIQQHRGRVVDSPGDNLLAEFPSVVQAVQCAVAVQRELHARNAELPPQRRMEFRIGINLGDVVVDGERIYGDGVNIAARLEGLAEGGGICISGTVYDQVETKLPLQYEALGEQAVKNIARPVRVYRLRREPVAATSGASEEAQAPDVAVGHTLPTQADAGRHVLAWSRRRGTLALVAVLLILGTAVTVWQRVFRATAPASLSRTEQAVGLPLPDKPSIAVLPFLNLSSNPEQEYFSDGITEDLITDLSKLSGLFVIARNSVFTYKGRSVKPAEVSRELGVRYVLEGSVRRAGHRVRITAQLIDATTGYHRWAERYDRELQDIFAVQEEIARKIMAALEVQLTQGEHVGRARNYSDNLEAYDYYLRGVEFYQRSTQEANAQAQQVFEKAIALDPQFAVAYAALGGTYYVAWAFQWTRDPQTLERAFALAQQAISLNASLSTAHRLLGYVYSWRQQHDQAVAAAEQAVELDPNNADGYAALADILNGAGRPQDAIGLVEKAMRLNPHYPFRYLAFLGTAYYATGRVEEAIAAFKRVRICNPDYLPAPLFLAAIYSEMDRETEAQAQVAELLRISPQFSLEVLRQTVGAKDREGLERLLDFLRKAGLR
jgi:adenylate cyclase